MEHTDTENLATLAEIHSSVMEYLQKEELHNPTRYSNLIIFSVRPNTIIKYIKDNSVAGRWGRDIYNQINNAIFYIYEDLIVNVKMPEIETQTQEDIILAKILKNTGFWIFHSSSFLNQYISISNVISFLNRDKEIFDWNTVFLIQVKQEVAKVKAYLLRGNDDS